MIDVVPKHLFVIARHEAISILRHFCHSEAQRIFANITETICASEWQGIRDKQGGDSSCLRVTKTNEWQKQTVAKKGRDSSYLRVTKMNEWQKQTVAKKGRDYLYVRVTRDSWQAGRRLFVPQSDKNGRVT